MELLGFLELVQVWMVEHPFMSVMGIVVFWLMFWAARRMFRNTRK